MNFENLGKHVFTRVLPVMLSLFVSVATKCDKDLPCKFPK